jgi:hypothetical protein
MTHNPADILAAYSAALGQYPDDPGPPEPPPDEPPPKLKLRDQLLTVSDLAHLPPVQPLVDGLLYRDTLAQLSGPPGSYKSFIAINVACALAAGQTNWEGHRIPARTPVVYVVAEGASGLYVRILAWCERNNVDPQQLDGWLHILPSPIQLGAATVVDEAVEMVHHVGAGLLVIDTRARCTLGLEENSATEQGFAVAAADRISGEVGATVWLIHHTGRNGQHPRGSTAWDGAVFSDLRLTADDGIVTITVEKHKDAPSGQIYDYRLISHTVSPEMLPDLHEQERKSLVIFSHWGSENRGGILTKILTANADRVREISENSCGLEGLSRTKLVALAVADGMAESSAYRAVNTLIERGVLTNVGTEKRPRYIRSGLSLIDDDNDAGDDTG